MSIAESSLEYPRTLVPETQVNGKTELPITCSDVEDCVKKCEFYSFNARDGGLPSPEACALCEPPCPDNLATTTVDLAIAVQHDIESALRLNAICQNSLAACACQTLMMLKPAWLANLESPVEKCSSASDVISLIMDRIVVDNIRQAESLVNGLIDGVNKIFGWIGEIDHVCSEYKTFKRCPEDPEALAALFGCQPGARASRTGGATTKGRKQCVSARPRRTTTTKTSSTPRRRASSSSSLPTSWATRTRACRPR